MRGGMRGDLRGRLFGFGGVTRGWPRGGACLPSLGLPWGLVACLCLSLSSMFGEGVVWGARLGGEKILRGRAKKGVDPCAELCISPLMRGRNPSKKNTEKNMNTEKKYWTCADLAVEALELSRRERGEDAGPRFTVYVDGDCLHAKTPRGLDRILKSIYSTEPRVFRNAGKGVTVDFL